MSELRRRLLIERNTTHGLRYHPLYQIWLSMKGRCYNKNDKSYYLYGEKMISKSFMIGLLRTIIKKDCRLTE